jgi:hypothetical protein
MKSYRRSAWQVIAVAAFAVTAALSVVLTRPQPAALTTAAAACRAGGLAAWLGTAADPGVVPRVDVPGPAKIDVYYTLEFTNVSSRTCSLYGYPDVSAYLGGRQVGGPAMLDTSVRPSTVTLAPRATAHAVLRYTGTASLAAAACKQVTVTQLRIYPPGSSGATFVPFTIPVCSREGPDFLSVQAVQPRAGVPGFPHY